MSYGELTYTLSITATGVKEGIPRVLDHTGKASWKMGNEGETEL